LKEKRGKKAGSAFSVIMFKPLSKWMQEKNSAYYKSPNTLIYDDFATYAQSEKGMLTSANARDFYSYAKKIEKKQYNILEVGVGNGAFCAGFLEEIARLDEKNNTSILSKINYVLADFSKPALERAKKFNIKLSIFCEIKTMLLDASKMPGTPEKQGAKKEKNKNTANFKDIKFDFIRCNELFSDLPANLYLQNEDGIFHALIDEKMQPSLEIAQNPDELERKLLLSLPKNMLIPINRAAADSILYFSSLLGDGGRMDIFDYGFYKKEDFGIPAQMWNFSIVRDFGGQWTVDLNFLYLATLFSSLGKSAHVEAQKEYVQKIMQKKLSLSEENGLDYSQSKDNFEEDDSFYHMRIQNSE